MFNFQELHKFNKTVCCVLHTVSEHIELRTCWTAPHLWLEWNINHFRRTFQFQIKLPASYRTFIIDNNNGLCNLLNIATYTMLIINAYRMLVKCNILRTILLVYYWFYRFIEFIRPKTFIHKYFCYPLDEVLHLLLKINSANNKCSMPGLFICFPGIH